MSERGKLDSSLDEQCVFSRIRSIIASSSVPEDPFHAEDTLAWLQKLSAEIDLPLKIAAYGHDIERALPEGQRTSRKDYADYDAFKAAHARKSAAILHDIMVDCGIDKDVVAEVCRLVTLHEKGGDPRSDLLKEADSLSFFTVNLPFYYQRETLEEVVRRCSWGYRRLSPRGRDLLAKINFSDPLLKKIIDSCLVGQVIATRQ